MTRFSIVRRAILAERSPLNVISWTIAAIALPTLGRWILDHGYHGVPFVTFFPAIVLAALFLGWRAASVTALACGIIGNRLFRVQPVLWEADATDAVMAGFYLVTCLILILTGDTLRRTVRKLDTSLAAEAVLRRELSHRVKNILAVAQSLAALTARKAPPDKFFPIFEGRLAALGRAVDILAQGEALTCRLADLIEQAINPFRSDDNFLLEGPDCEISRECCVQLVLVIHELCTNALKYGALSTAHGRVRIDWASDGNPRNEVTIRWIEEGGPHVIPPARTGMGTRLLNARPELIEVKTQFEGEGVSCVVQVRKIEPASD